MENNNVQIIKELAREIMSKNTGDTYLIMENMKNTY